jgi:hypothetical protein
MFEGVEPMGRGRAKAKQVKVARQLKYRGTDGTDLDRLRTELGVGGAEQDRHDSYGDLADRYNDGEDDEDEDDG